MAAAALAVLGGLALAAPASAEDPFAVSDRVVDASTDQVAADAIDQLTAAADEVVAETDYDLWTVYVDSFDGMSAVEWANETAIASGADSDVLLLAIAVEDRDVGLSVDEDAALSNSDVTDIEAAARSAARDGDWVEASLAAADAVIEISTGVAPTTEPTSAGESSGSGGGVLGWLVAGVVVLAIVGGVIALARRRGGGAAAQPRQQPSGPPSPEQQWASLSTSELGTRAGSALVALDNDVRSCANELAFAEAQFGIEATREFKATLEQAQQQLGQAFAIQQQLGDSTPEPEDAQRQGLIEILRLCQAAETALDSQTQALAELRALQDRAPALLDELDQRAGELEARVPAARDTLNQLGATYPATALATVAKAPDQAQALLDSAEQSIAEGRSRVQADDRGTAVAFARTAEDALQQVGTLLEMVAHAGQTLAEASSSLDDAIASLTSDVSDAGRLAPSDPTIAPVLERAQAALQAGAATKSGGDPIAALNELAAAEQALDAALAPRREQEQVQARAADQLTGQLAAADSAIRQVDAFIETNRGAVQTGARTWLTAAQESIGRARDLQATDVQAALAAARTAHDNATTALQMARDDVDRWHRIQRQRSVGGGGGYYGRSGGIDGGSLILGGILNEVTRGGSGSRSSSGYGGWGGSGARTGGGSGGGSRGGSGLGRSIGSVGRSSGSRRSSGSSRRSGGGRRR